MILGGRHITGVPVQDHVFGAKALQLGGAPVSRVSSRMTSMISACLLVGK
jgi:hypothetical protein